MERITYHGVDEEKLEKEGKVISDGLMNLCRDNLRRKNGLYDEVEYPKNLREEIQKRDRKELEERRKDFDEH